MWFDQIEHCSSQPDQRERSDTAGDRRFVELVGFLEGEAEKKGQCEHQRQPIGDIVFSTMPIPPRATAHRCSWLVGERQLIFTMMTVITAATSEAARAKL